MRTKWFLIGFVVAAILAVAAMTLAAPRTQDYQGLQWEYAMAVVNTHDHEIVIAVRDRDERQEIEIIANALPDDQKSIYNVHNLLGLYGWELVQMDMIEGNQVGTYKRIVVGSGAG